MGKMSNEGGVSGGRGVGGDGRLVFKSPFASLDRFAPKWRSIVCEDPDTDVDFRS